MTVKLNRIWHFMEEFIRNGGVLSIQLVSSMKITTHIMCNLAWATNDVEYSLFINNMLIASQTIGKQQQEQ